MPQSNFRSFFRFALRSSNLFTWNNESCHFTPFKSSIVYDTHDIVNFDVLRYAGHVGADRVYDLLSYTGGGYGLVRALVREELGEGHVVPVGHLHHRYALGLLELGLAGVEILFGLLFDVSLVDESLLEQLVRVNLQHVRVILYDLVHERLGQHGLVHLVVSVSTVAHYVHDHVVVVLAPVLHGDLAAVDDRVRVVGVDVEYRSVDHAREIGAVVTAPRVSRIRGEADLCFFCLLVLFQIIVVVQLER